jgi:hypothetical protein
MQPEVVSKPPAPVVPFHGQLRCEACGMTVPCLRGDAVAYARTYWPTHCSRRMSLEDGGLTSEPPPAWMRPGTPARYHPVKGGPSVRSLILVSFPFRACGRWVVKAARIQGWLDVECLTPIARGTDASTAALEVP